MSNIIDTKKEKWERNFDIHISGTLEEYIDEILADLEELRAYVELGKLFYDNIVSGANESKATIQELKLVLAPKVYDLFQQIRSKQ